MRIRTIKPEFWAHEDISRLSAETVLLAIGLLNWCDDEGYFRANPELIRAAIFPLRKLSRSLPVMLSELSSVHYIRLFKGDPDGRDYGHVIHFLDHQKISNPSQSKIKDKDLGNFSEASRNPTVSLIEASCEEGKGTGNKEQGKEGAKAPIVFPANLDNPDFRQAWIDWLAYRKEQKYKPLKDRSLAGKLAELSGVGSALAIDAIRYSIANGYQGVDPSWIKKPQGKASSQFRNLRDYNQSLDALQVEFENADFKRRNEKDGVKLALAEKLCADLRQRIKDVIAEKTQFLLANP